MEKIKQIMEQTVAENEYMKLLGIEWIQADAKHCIARMPYKKAVANPYGTIHGGVLYSLGDIVAGTAACLEGRYVTTVSGTLNFMLPAGNTQYIYCEALQLRMGHHLAVYEVKMKNDEGKLTDSGEFTFFVTEQSVEDVPKA